MFQSVQCQDESGVRVSDTCDAHHGKDGACRVHRKARVALRFTVFYSSGEPFQETRIMYVKSSVP